MCERKQVDTVGVVVEEVQVLLVVLGDLEHREALEVRPPPWVRWVQLVLVVPFFQRVQEVRAWRALVVVAVGVGAVVERVVEEDSTTQHTRAHNFRDIPGDKGWRFFCMLGTTNKFQYFTSGQYSCFFK